jgi:hypothetical protein
MTRPLRNKAQADFVGIRRKSASHDGNAQSGHYKANHWCAAFLHLLDAREA